MAYFSKEIYQRKREYAYSVSNEGLEKIAIYLISENPKYKNVDLNDESVSDKIDSEIDDLIEELQPIADLSHKRHEIHSTDRWHYVNGYTKELSEVGDSFSDDSIIDEVNRLNKKYNLANSKVPYINDEYIPTDDESTEDIFDYFNEDYDEEKDEDDLRDEALELLYYGWNDIIDKWSDSVRKWFKEINKKFDTDFPD